MAQKTVMDVTSLSKLFPIPKRWVIRKKAQFIELVRAHPHQRSALLKHAVMSEEEFRSWERKYDGGGMRELKEMHPKTRRGGIK